MSLLWIRAIISSELGTLGRGFYVLCVLVLECLGRGCHVTYASELGYKKAKLSYGAAVADAIQLWMDDI